MTTQNKPTYEVIRAMHQKSLGIDTTTTFTPSTPALEVGTLTGIVMNVKHKVSKFGAEEKILEGAFKFVRKTDGKEFRSQALMMPNHIADTFGEGEKFTTELSYIYSERSPTKKTLIAAVSLSGDIWAKLD